MTRHPLPPAVRREAIEKRFVRWTPRTLDGALDTAVEEFSDRAFVVTPDVVEGEADTPTTWTYAGMAEWSRRIAAGLAELGVGRGDHVALVLANYAEFVAVRYAIARLGAVSVPINVANRTAEIGFILRRSDASVLVTMDRFRGLDYLRALDELAPGWERGVASSAFPALRHVVVLPTGDGDPRPGTRTVADLAASAPRAGGPAAEPDDVADILFTSGTTGQPKGVQLTHDMLLRTAYGSTWGRAYPDAHRVVFSLPLFHVYGYVEGLLTVPFVGGAIVVHRTFDPDAILEAIETHRGNDALMIPTMTAELIRAQRENPRDLSSLTHLYSSGGVSPDDVWAEIDEVLDPGETVTGYGMSETTASTTCTWPEDPPERRATTNGRMKRAGVAGDPALDGRLVVYKTVDTESGEDLLSACSSSPAVGELVCRGPGVTSGYYRDPVATAAALTADGWLRTGDLGIVDADEYLHLLGRTKDSYRCGGEQVLPGDVETVLARHPSIHQAFVVPVPDTRRGEVGFAWVVPREGAAVVSEDLVAWCSEHLARFKVPRHVVEIDPADIPLTASGRARKFLLAERAVERLGSP